MALRLLELVLPQAHQETKDRLLETFPCAGRWEIPLAEDNVLTTLLLDAKRVEPLMDELERRYSSDKTFRIVLLPVEAAAPAEALKIGKGDLTHELDLSSSRVSREELYQDVRDACGVSPIFIASVILSTVVASAGLLMDNAPAIIGAMVIAPLLGPNSGLALATVLADFKLALRSAKANLIGFTMALGMACAVGAIWPLETLGSELTSRSSAGAADMAIALAAGVAGSIAFTSPVSTSLVGVMVAVALLPPTVAAGILAGAGYWQEAAGAALLVAINITCVNLAGVATFVAQGIRPKIWYEAKRAKTATQIAFAIWLSVLALLAVLVAYSYGFQMPTR
jgi:uncharacterized hydrophobic protein (TIGR00341 family)